MDTNTTEMSKKVKSINNLKEELNVLTKMIKPLEELDEEARTRSIKYIVDYFEIG